MLSLACFLKEVFSDKFDGQPLNQRLKENNILVLVAVETKHALPLQHPLDGCT
jgi:hypothetical protein